MDPIVIKNVEVKNLESDPAEGIVTLKLTTSHADSNVLWSYKFVPFDEGKRWSDIRNFYACGVKVKFNFKNKQYTYTCESDNPNPFTYGCEPKLPQNIVDATEVSDVYIIRRNQRVECRR